MYNERVRASWLLWGPATIYFLLRRMSDWAEDLLLKGADGRSDGRDESCSVVNRKERQEARVTAWCEASRGYFNSDLDLRIVAQSAAPSAKQGKNSNVMSFFWYTHMV